MAAVKYRQAAMVLQRPKLPLLAAMFNRDIYLCAGMYKSLDIEDRSSMFRFRGTGMGDVARIYTTHNLLRFT